MFGFIHKTNEQVNSARGTVYNIYEGAPVKSEALNKRALLESAKHFFRRKKEIGVLKAFCEATSNSTKPEWLLWAVAPAITQLEHNDITTHGRVKPVPPPWSLNG